MRGVDLERGVRVRTRAHRHRRRGIERAVRLGRVERSGSLVPSAGRRHSPRRAASVRGAGCNSEWRRLRAAATSSSTSGVTGASPVEPFIFE